MKVLTPGHRYELDNFINPELPGQIVQFIQKKPDPEAPENLITEFDGAYTEDVIEMVIDRMKFLNESFPCRENAQVITKLEEAIHWLDHRTKNRIKRGVEGKHIR